jgi:hypothetical protein
MLLQRRGERLLVQCKHWKAWQVGTPAVAELRKLVDDEGLDNGLLITAGKFSPEAAALAEDSGLLLLDGDDLLRMAAGGPVLPLAEETTSQWALPKGWTAFGAPTCPLCEAPMLYKKVRAGAHTGMRFWGCRNYPTCRAIREVGPAYAGLPLERPAPGAETDAEPIGDEIVAVEDVPAQNEAAEEATPSLDVVVAAEFDHESVDEDAVGDDAMLVQVLPAAPAPVAVLPAVPLPVAPLPVADPPPMPLPTAPLIESVGAEALGAAAEPVDAASAEAVQVDVDSVEPSLTATLPAAPPPSAAPITTDSADDAPITGDPQVSESSALAMDAILPSAPVPQLLPAPVMAAEEPDLAIAEPAIAELASVEPTSAELPAPELPTAAPPPVEQPVMAPMVVPVQPVATAAAPPEPPVVPVAPATDAAPRAIPPAPVATVMPPVPTAPSPAAVAAMPTFPPVAAPIAATVEAPQPALATPPGIVAPDDDSTVNPPLSPAPTMAPEPVVEPAAVETPPAVVEDAPASPLGWADPELAEPEVAEPGAILRRRAELGLPELQLPQGSEDSYRVLLAHPTWTDPRDEDDDVPGFVPEEHAPYQWPTSADLVENDRAPISWPESAPEPAEVVAEAAAASPSRRRHFLMVGAVLAVAAVLTVAVAVLIPAVMSAMKLIMH